MIDADSPSSSSDDERLEIAARFAFKALGPKPGSGGKLAALDPRAGRMPRLEQGSKAGATSASAAHDIRPVRGNYEILGEVARGGMGIIVKGRDKDLGRIVAMKVLQPKHAARPNVLQRFVEEARIGGQLQHPGIVPVYEMGTLDDQRPFFSMKLVQGRTLAELLASRAVPSEDQRRFLAIFEQVAQTMAYAHATGVIHRDLKPANIMVGAFGEVQVVDWGLAKVMQGSAPEVADDDPASLATPHESGASPSHVGAVMGTPSYMPPEQARGEIDRLDRRCDVFALGGILCEILTGQPPYVAGDRTLAKAIAAELDDARARLAVCGCDAVLVRLVERCLAPEPDERPASAQDVAREITAFLTSVEERARRAEMSAHAALVKAEEERRARRLMMALAASILIGLGVSLWFMRRADQQHRAAEVAREESDEVTRFLSDMLQAGNPQVATHDVTVRQVLDHASKQLGQLADRPTVQARLARTIASTYVSLGEYTLAEPYLQQALRLTTAARGVDDPRTLALQSELGHLRLRQGQESEAEAMLLESLAKQRRLVGSDDEETLKTAESLVQLYFGARRLDEAEPLVEEILETKRRVLGARDPSTALALQQKAELYAMHHEFPKAEATLLEAIEILESLGDDAECTLDARSNLAGLYLAQQDFVRAERCYRELMEPRRRVLGEHHPKVLADLCNLASCAWASHRYDEAQHLYEEAVRLRREVTSVDDPDSLAVKHNLAVLYAQQNQIDKAVVLLEEIVTAARGLLPSDHWELGVYLSKYGSGLRRQRRFDESEKVLLEAWDILSARLGVDDARAGLAATSLFELYQDQGLNDKAREWRERALGDQARSSIVEPIAPGR